MRKYLQMKELRRSASYEIFIKQYFSRNMEQAQILNKDQEKAVKVATEIALKSHDDSVFLVTPRGAVWSVKADL